MESLVVRVVNQDNKLLVSLRVPQNTKNAHAFMVSQVASTLNQNTHKKHGRAYYASDVQLFVDNALLPDDDLQAIKLIKTKKDVVFKERQGVFRTRVVLQGKADYDADAFDIQELDVRIRKLDDFSLATTLKRIGQVAQSARRDILGAFNLKGESCRNAHVMCGQHAFSKDGIDALAFVEALLQREPCVVQVAASITCETENIKPVYGDYRDRIHKTVMHVNNEPIMNIGQNALYFEHYDVDNNLVVEPNKESTRYSYDTMFQDPECVINIPIEFPPLMRRATTELTVGRCGDLLDDSPLEFGSVTNDDSSW